MPLARSGRTASSPRARRGATPNGLEPIVLALAPASAGATGAESAPRPPAAGRRKHCAESRAKGFITCDFRCSGQRGSAHGASRRGEARDLLRAEVRCFKFNGLGHPRCTNLRCSRVMRGRGRKAIRASIPERDRIMLIKRLAALLIPLFISGAALAAPPAQKSTSEQASEEKAKLSKAFSVLHAVGQWGINLSAMAEKRAKSDLVKGYASTITAGNASMDAKLTSIAKEHGIEVVPLDPRSEDGKSLLDRMKAEAVLLGSLEGDAWDKEYMTLVTNTQQSVSRLLKASKASATDQEVRKFLGEIMATVQGRLKTAQDILEKVYGDQV
jgi:predicted outer membrane protein